MSRDKFETSIENILIGHGWNILPIDKNVTSKIKRLTDHDIIVYKCDNQRIIILEIQCKDENDANTFDFGKINNTTKFGFFSWNTLFVPQFREVDSTNLEPFIRWRYKKKGIKTDMRNRLIKNPLIQIFLSSIDTLRKLRDDNNKKLLELKKLNIILFPIIIYKNLKSNFYPLRIEPPEKFYTEIKPYMDEFYSDYEFPRGSFPLLLINENALKNTNILCQLEKYFTYPNIFKSKK